MSEIQTVLDEIKKYQKPRQKFVDYYDGRHELNFATQKFKNTFGQMLQSMRDNLCPIVVDAVADRMEIINFAGDDSDKKITDEAWQLWQRSNMELLSNETHVEAVKTGVAYLIVWRDAFGNAKFYLQDSRNFALLENEDTKEPLYAGKVWQLPDKRLRLTMYYPDRTEKFITANKYEAGVSDLKESIFQKFEDEGDGGVVQNPYGVLPVFKFEVKPVLNDAIPIQDALNKTVCDKLVAMEFGAFRQRWATGIEFEEDPVTGKPQLPFKAGVDRVWFTEGKEVKFGEFEATALEPYLKVADSYRLEMARVSGTPLHFFSINTSDAISGEALKTLESRFTKKVGRICLNFGPVWARAMRFALMLEGRAAPENLAVQWASPEQRSEKEFLETLGLKRDNLDIPVDVLREEFGYTKEDIAKFNAFEEPIPDDELEGVAL